MEVEVVTRTPWVVTLVASPVATQELDPREDTERYTILISTHTPTPLPTQVITITPTPTVAPTRALTVTLIATPTAVPAGYVPMPQLYGASQYGPGVMEGVIANRVAGRTEYDLPQYLPATNGWVAVLDCRRIGEIWELRPVGHTEWESFLVVDCSGHTSTTEWLTANNIAVEIDYASAQRWDTVGRRIQVEIREWEGKNDPVE